VRAIYISSSFKNSTEYSCWCEIMMMRLACFVVGPSRPWQRRIYTHSRCCHNNLFRFVSFRFVSFRFVSFRCAAVINKLFISNFDDTVDHIDQRIHCIDKHHNRLCYLLLMKGRCSGRSRRKRSSRLGLEDKYWRGVWWFWLW
jgi:hypothetical protein